jgi:hypothetical protein
MHWAFLFEALRLFLKDGLNFIRFDMPFNFLHLGVAELLHQASAEVSLREVGANG